MEIHPNGSSFGASLTLQTTNSFRDVSFSSYLNQAEEQMIRKLTNQASDVANDHSYRNKEKDGELGVFGAEKYFKEEIDERINNSYCSRIGMNLEDEPIKEFDQRLSVKVKGDQTNSCTPSVRSNAQTNTRTPSVRSNASCNSRVGLLPRVKPATGGVENRKTRTFLASFGCNCINKKSTQINEKKLIQAREISKPQIRMLDCHQQNVPPSSNSYSTERKIRNHDYFTFPVLNSNDLHSNNSKNSKNLNPDHSNSKNSKNLAGNSLTLGQKLSLLSNWNVDIPTEDEMYIPSSGMYNPEVDSDSSSDLFEIESFSTTGNSSFVAPRPSESNGYAPSEVSVDWSVVTASAADFSVVSDYDEVRTGGWRISGGNDQVNKDDQKKRAGMLSGCVSHKAVRVAGDECKVGGGGAGGRRRLSESVAVGGMFRGGIV